MKRYCLILHLDTRRFGSVWKVIDQINNEVVRLIKKLHSKNEYVNIEELQSLLSLASKTPLI